jgi:hypothetical protein
MDMVTLTLEPHGTFRARLGHVAVMERLPVDTLHTLLSTAYTGFTSSARGRYTSKSYWARYPKSVLAILASDVYPNYGTR